MTALHCSLSIFPQAVFKFNASIRAHGQRLQASDLVTSSTIMEELTPTHVGRHMTDLYIQALELYAANPAADGLCLMEQTDASAFMATARWEHEVLFLPILANTSQALWARLIKLRWLLSQRPRSSPNHMVFEDP